MIVDLKIGNTIDLLGTRYSEPFYHLKRLDSNNNRFALQWWFVDNKERVEVSKDEGQEVIEQVITYDEFFISFICDVDFAHIVASLKMLDYFQLTIDDVVITADEWESEIVDIADYNEQFRKCEITYRINFRDKKAGDTNYIVDAPNVVPIAYNVRITGSNNIGDTISGQYNYDDEDDDAEGTSTFKWFRANNSSGAGLQLIAGATAQTYTLVPADLNKYIFFQVIPVAATGASPGDPVRSIAFTAETNVAPVAIDMTMVGEDGKFEIRQTWTGDYTYLDINDDDEGTTLLKWQIADDANGTINKSTIGNSLTQPSGGAKNIDRYMRFGVKPVALTGISPGEWTFVDWQLISDQT